MTTTSGVGATSFAAELAALLIENETTQAESASQSRESARESYLANVNEQVAELRDAASATLTGALVGAGFSVANGACQIGAANYQYKADVARANGECGKAVAQLQLDASQRSAGGKLFGELGAATKTIAFDTAAGMHQAQAKVEESQAEQANWHASDASTSIDKADKAIDKYLDLLQGIQRDQSGANNAIIGRI